MEESGEQAAKNAKPASLRNTANSLLLARWISKHSKQNKSKIEDHSTKSPPPSSVELPMEGYYRNIGDVDCSTEIDCSSQHINKEIDCSSQHINKEIDCSSQDINKEIDCSSQHINKEIDCSSQDINEDFIKNILVEHTRRMHCRFQLYEDLEELSKIDESNIESFLTACKPHELNVLLLHASYSGRADLIRRLCEHKVNVNYAEPDQNLTALHLCAFRNCLDGVQHLITRDAKVHFREKHTPLYYAVLGDSYDVAHYFVQQGISQESSQNKETLLHVAARRNAHRVLSLLVANNKELERLDSNGFAAIHHAAEAGNSNCLHVLLKAGCPVDLPTGKNDTALHLAAEASYVDNVFLLIEAKANLQLKNHQGHTALHLAARSQSLECVEVLLKVGADPNAEDDDGRSPLHLALSHQSLVTDDIVELLLTWKTNVNKADKCGYTPLHIAASKELSQSVNLLIRHDANLSAKTNRGITALSIILPKTPTYLDMFVRKLDAFVTLHRQEFIAHELELRLDFSPLLQHRQDGEIGYLNTLVKQGYKEILEHPLCQSFLHLKWQKIRKYYAIRLLFYLVYMLILTSWVIVGLTYNCYNESHKNWDGRVRLCTNKEGLIGIFYKHPMAFEIHWYILVTFTVLEIVRTLTVMPNYQIRQYFTQMQNLVNWCVILSVFTTFVYAKETYRWQSYLGAFVVLCGWINLMLMIGQLPMFGPYVVMFTSVQVEVFKLLLAYGCLLVGFTASFCVIFPHSDSFGNLHTAFLKILAMMTGELNIDDLFWLNEENYKRFFSYTEISWVVLQISAQLCFLLFVLFVTIVLMNLLIGIAVRDIKGLQKTAGLIKLVQQIKLIYDMEVSIFAFLPKRMICLRWSTLIHPSPLPVVLIVNPLNPKEKRLPRDILLAAYEKAKEGENRNNVAISCKKPYGPDSYEKL